MHLYVEIRQMQFHPKIVFHNNKFERINYTVIKIVNKI